MLPVLIPGSLDLANHIASFATSLIALLILFKKSQNPISSFKKI